MAKLDDVQSFVRSLLTDADLRKKAVQSPSRVINHAVSLNSDEQVQLTTRESAIQLGLVKADFAINTWIAGTTAYIGALQLCPLDYLTGGPAPLPPLLSVDWNPSNDAMRALGFWQQVGSSSTSGVRQILENLAQRLSVGSADEKNIAHALRAILFENF